MSHYENWNGNSLKIDLNREFLSDACSAYSWKMATEDQRVILIVSSE